MLGSLKQFIQIDLPQINHKLSTQQNQQDESKMNTINEHSKHRVRSNILQYEPSDKTHLLTRFNQKNQSHKKNTSLDNYSRNFRSHSERKPLYQHVSFFGKNQITKDYIAKSELKRKHNLLRAIIRTNQNQNQNEGFSDYDQSFKRLYEKFQSIYAKPIIECRNFVIDQKDNELPIHNSVQIQKKQPNFLNHRKRIQYENCLSWARKHKKKQEFYETQLGKNLKQKKQENLNAGHSLMCEVEKKLKMMNLSSRLE